MRQQRLFLALFVLLCAATLVPFWVGEYLPFLDLPNHLAAIHVWHFYDDPRFDYSTYYKLQLAPLPYWAHYYSVHLLCYLFDIQIANKIYLSAYALAIPIGSLLFARQFGRSHYLSLFSFPLVWNMPLTDGFLAFVGGVAVLPLGLTLVDAYCSRQTILRGLSVVVLGTSLYFFHLLPYVYFLLCAGLIVLCHRIELKSLVLRGVPVLASAAVGAWAYRHSADMKFHPLQGRGYKPVMDNAIDTLGHAPHYLIDVLSSSRDEWVLVVLAASWIVLASTAARRDREPDPKGRLHEWVPEICFSVAALAFAFLPRSIMRPFYWHFINGRYVVIAALLLITCIRGRIDGARRLLLVPVVLASLFYFASLTRAINAFNRRVAGFDEVMAQVPLHKQVLMLSLPPLGDPDFNVNPFNQWPSQVQIHHGGYNFYNFNEGFPLAYKIKFPAPAWNHPEWFRFTDHGGSYDYFLTHNEGVRYSPFSELVKEGKVEKVIERGSFALWKKLENPAKGDNRQREPIDLRSEEQEYE